MKLFFAKFLPIKGELKEGDKWWDGKKICDDWDSREAWNTCNGKPVKLFLCSRDIQVGDTFTYIPPDGNGKELTQTATEDTIEALKTITFPYWKVIGEISPDAIWVKEKDEFGEDEVQKYSNLAISLGRASESNIWEIKGPCGHFH